MTFAFGDVDRACSTLYQSFGDKTPICGYATVAEAEEAIMNFYGRASGADPGRGWEMLTPEEQMRFSRDAFATKWINIGWTELVSMPVQVAKKSNTFFVISRTYGSPTNESTDKQGTVDVISEEIRVKKVADEWLVDGIRQLDREEPRRTIKYGIATLAEDQDTLNFPHQESTVAWGGKDGNILPVYCQLSSNPEMGDAEPEWLRSSMGWLDASKVRLQSNQSVECNSRYEVVSQESRTDQ